MIIKQAISLTLRKTVLYSSLANTQHPPFRSTRSNDSETSASR